MSIPSHVGRRAVIALAITAVSLAGAGCSRDDKATKDKPTAEVLAEAKTTLDETSGIKLALSTKDLPEGVQGLVAATGIATHDPAFDGSITVVVAGTNVPVPVVAVGGKVFAQIPLTTGWSDVDPEDYGAPDPAELMSPDTGFSSLLPVTSDVKKGKSVRGGADNDEVLTEYSGTVPGAAMKKVIPSSSGDTFEATYSITDKGELRNLVLTGVFYPDTEPMTYTVDFTDYGTKKTITAP